MGSTISVVEAETVTQNTEEHRGGFRGGPMGARPSLLLNKFFFLIPWVIEIVDFIQTSYSKNIVFV